MKKIAAIMAVLTAICVGTATAQKRVTFEDSDIKITSKLGPQYVATRIYAGDAGAVTLYYQVSAIVTGVGETAPTAITVTNAPTTMSSSDSIQLLWSKVPEATSYNVYKATAAGVYRLVTNVDNKTQQYIDTGVEGGALYTAADRPGGNLNVENDLIVGGDATIANLTVTGTLSPYSTGTFTAEDVTVEDDVAVGDDLTVTGLVTIGETLDVTGALTGTSAAFSTTLNAAGQVTMGASATLSTVSVAGAATFHTSVTAPDLTATDDVTVGDDLNVTGLATIGETLNVTGQTTLGAAPTLSTVTAAGVATFHASVGVPNTGMVYVGLRTLAQLGAATAVLGEIGICSDCTPVEVFISTAAGAPGTGGYANAVGLQLD